MRGRAQLWMDRPPSQGLPGSCLEEAVKAARTLLPTRQGVLLEFVAANGQPLSAVLT